MPAVLLIRLLISPPEFASWGNFVVPPFAQDIRTPWYVWNPYQANGFIYFIPASNVSEAILFSLPTAITTRFVGYEPALLLYIIGSLILLSFAFYMLTSLFVDSRIPRVIATIVFVANPLSLQLIAAGDFIQFSSEALVIVSLTLLALSLRRPLCGRSLLLASISVGLFSLTADFPQLMLVGFAFWMVIGVAALLRSGLANLRDVPRVIAQFSLSTLALVAALAYFFLPLLSTGYNYAGTSTSALSVSQFRSSSSSPIELLLLKGYPPNLGWLGVQSALSGLFFAWSILCALLITVSLAAIILRPTKRNLALVTAVVVGCTLGSGPAGPLGSAALYLYLHFPAYALLNNSYYWDWIVIMPAICLLLASTLQSAERHGIPTLRHWLNVPVLLRPMGQYHVARHPQGRAVKVTAFSLIVAIALVFTAIPVASQGYYGDYDNGVYGVHSSYLPSDMSHIMHEVATIIGNNSTGVAILNPDDYISITNTTGPTNDPLVLYPSQRTVGLPFGAVGSNDANYYFFWLYQQFYENRTDYFAQLMSIEGISIFVVLFNSESASYFPYYMPWSLNVNASTLMTYQVGVKSVYLSARYQIFEAINVSEAAAALQTQTIVLGDYNTLSELPYAGLSLYSRSFDFVPDLASGPVLPFNRTSMVVVDSPTSLVNLAVSLTSSSIVNPMGSVESSAASTSTWTSSYSQSYLGNPYTDALPFPIAVAQSSGINLTLPVKSSAAGSVEVWVCLLFTPDGGVVNVSIDGHQIGKVNTTEYSGLTNQLDWIHLNATMPTRGPNTLTITSGGEVTGFRAALIAKPGQIESALTYVSDQLEADKVPVVDIYSASQIAVVPHTFYGFLPSTPTSSGEYFDLGNPNLGPPVSISVPLITIGAPGRVVMRVLANGWQQVRISTPGSSVTEGFLSSQYNLSTSSWGTVESNINVSAMITPLKLSLIGGTSFLSLLLYVPTGAFSSSTTAPLAPLGNATVVVSKYVAGAHFVYGHSGNSINISGTFKYLGGATGLDQLVSISFPTASLSTDLMVSGHVTGGFVFAYDGLQFSGVSSGASVTYAGDFELGAVPNTPEPTSIYFFPPQNDSNGAYVSDNVSFTIFVTSLEPSNNIFSVRSDLLPGAIDVGYDESGFSLQFTDAVQYLLVRAPYSSAFVSESSLTRVMPDGGGLTTLVEVNERPKSTVYIGIASWQDLEIGLLLQVISVIATFGAGVSLSALQRNRRGRKI